MSTAAQEIDHTTAELLRAERRRLERRLMANLQMDPCGPESVTIYRHKPLTTTEEEN